KLILPNSVSVFNDTSIFTEKKASVKIVAKDLLQSRDKSFCKLQHPVLIKLQ
ncbi:unnamed protein product, partial [Arabidopsis halleri]